MHERRARGTTDIRSFDPLNAGEREMRAAHAFHAAKRAERWPEDPPLAYDELVHGLTNIPPFAGIRIWGAWRGPAMVGWASVSLAKMEENRRLAQCELDIAPEARRQGLGTALLAHIAEAAANDGRSQLLAGTDASIPAGEAFARRLGAKPGMTMVTNQLELASVDRALLRAWIERAPSEAFELGLWTGPYPEEDLPAIIELLQVMNTAPREDLEIEDMRWTPEQLREIEQALAGRGHERWTLYARHRETGELAGYTQVFWSPEQPKLLGQGDTGVLPRYRGHGLGKWLKAAMLEKVFAERPQVAFIRTGNAGSNAAMLKINHELGFRERKRATLWQVDLDRVQRYLEERGVALRQGLN